MRFRRRTQPGAPPGTIVPDIAAPPAVATLLSYDAEKFEERPIQSAEQVVPYLGAWPVTWINVDGIGDTRLISELGRVFDLHRLTLEDVIHVHQRAKVEGFDRYYFFVLRMPRPGMGWETEQISFYFGDRYVLTFQEHSGGDCLDAVRMRIRSGWGRARCARPDWLFYALLDVIVNHYFPLLEECGERLDELEAEILAGAGEDVMSRIHAIKRDLLTVRRIMWPLRDAIGTLLRDSNTLIADETRIYLRDVHDHTVQIVDLLESYRDLSSGLTDVYLSTVSQRTNEIMKVLTIISTVFIPITFVAGVYGMNFRWMPELERWWGYPAALLLMLGMAGFQVVYFWRRGWIGRPRSPAPLDVFSPLDAPPREAPPK